MCSLNKIDNSSLIPAYVPDNSVTLDKNGTPDWATQLIMAQIRVITATPEGTLESAVKVLDHYAEMGVNGIWVSPVYEPGEGGNGYSNLGPHTVDPKITGTSDYKAGWLKVAEFVKQAHKRNIRILLDLISWGTVKGSSLYKEHPDWYTGKDEWGGDAFNWENTEFKEWYIKTAVEIIAVTGCDGFRYDVEPHYAGYKVDKEIKDRLLKLGRKTFMMSESGNDRKDTYDCEQLGITNSIPGYYEENPVWYFLDRYNIVDSIKLGVNIGSGLWKQKPFAGCQYRFYVNTVTCHDHRYPVVCRNRLAIGYQAIFSPFIPQWYIGEEWNNPLNIIPGEGGRVLYFNEINWEAAQAENNRNFFEDVKKMIRVRREYPEVFGFYPPHFKDINICKVKTYGGNLQSYARFAGNIAFMIIPNFSDTELKGLKAQIPYSSIGFEEDGEIAVSDAYTGKIISKMDCKSLEYLTVDIAAMDQRVIKLELNSFK